MNPLTGKPLFFALKIRYLFLFFPMRSPIFLLQVNLTNR